MNFSFNSRGNFWQEGIFAFPRLFVTKYIKIASEYQIKALLIIMAENGGEISSKNLARRLGIPESDAISIAEFWEAEGIINFSDSKEVKVDTAYETKKAKPVQIKNDDLKAKEEKSAEPEKTEPEKEKKKYKVEAPSLSPDEIVSIAESDRRIGEVLQEAQKIFGRTISHPEQETIVNLITFYGMKPEVIMLLLTYCQSENEAGRKKSCYYMSKVAENWVEDGIFEFEDAAERLDQIKRTDYFWREVKERAQLTKKNPTKPQREMLERWQNDFSRELIFAAIDEMLDNIDNPNLKYVDTILKGWKKKGITTPAQAKKDKEDFQKRKSERGGKKSTGKISRPPTYDLEKVKKKIKNNTKI